MGVRPFLITAVWFNQRRYWTGEGWSTENARARRYDYLEANGVFDRMKRDGFKTVLMLPDSLKAATLVRSENRKRENEPMPRPITRPEPRFH